MYDFLNISMIEKKGSIELCPEFLTICSKDIMTRGRDFYAIWDEENNIWSTNEYRAKELIDNELYSTRKKIEDTTKSKVSVSSINSVGSRGYDLWIKYKKTAPDSFKPLNSKIIFKSQVCKKDDYSNIRLDYDLEEGEPENYNKLFGVIFSDEEREKLEWAIGSIFTGDSKKIQKFIVLYGDPGTGKSTYLENVIMKLFKGYYATFIAKELAGGNSQFSLEPFKNNPLVGIQPDGDLRRIFDNTKLNSIIAHEEMVVNEKNKSLYSMKFNTFLFMGTNYPVDISSSKSGMTRRLIVVQPTGHKVNARDFDKLVSGLEFEKGKIANKCIATYKRLGKHYYDKYVAEEMKYETDDFYNFIEEDYYMNLKDINFVQGNAIWKRYKQFCEDNNVRFVLSYAGFRSELKGYFREFYKVKRVNNILYRNLYSGFKTEKIGIFNIEEPAKIKGWIELFAQDSIFDKVMAGVPAQYANDEDKPLYPWSKVITCLGKLDTSKVHYVKVPENHIVIDFDLKGDSGNKSLELNLEAASKFPKTYCEVSKGGQGLHLHYIYDGDVNELAAVYEPGVEIKVFKGGSSLRRRLSKCNDIPIAHISSGLPLKEAKKVLNFEGFKNEQKLRDFIMKCLAKEHHGATKPEVDFIFKKLEEAYDSDLSYDVRDLRDRIFKFCMDSSNQSDICLKMFDRMHFCSKDYEEKELVVGVDKEAPIIFLDVEVFPNLFLVCWKELGEGKKVVRMYNPPAEEVEKLFKYRIIGFNNRRYDNHMLYAASMGYSPIQIFKLSQRIIVDKDRNAFFGEAYNLSYTDVYDFSTKGQGLKKWEIELGIDHKEIDIPWDKDVAEELWDTVGDYCENDVIATEKVFLTPEVQEDFKAREILADISGLTVNDTTNQHTIRIITNGDKNPQKNYIYTDLATGERSDGTVDKIKFPGYQFSATGLDKELYPKDEKGKPVYTTGKSIYKGIDPSEGGYANGWPGVYFNVGLFDVKSMHPSSAENLMIFGEEYTGNFSNIKRARILIKEGKFEEAGEMFDGKLKKYLDNPDMAERLAYALKIAINSVYGLTSASFDNKLRDPRNVDNIVAKRGALFMIDLIEEVIKLGYKVVHVKTDSIKVANADNYISKFIYEFGLMYGYEFDFEAVYEKMCIVNDAVYVAKYASKDYCKEMFGYIPKDNKKHEGEWTATGKEFQVPYIFKTLFTGEPITIDDLSVVNSVTTAMYLDISNKGPEQYVFVGRVGKFTPIKPGCGGGTLLAKRETNGVVKYVSVSGAKGYEWLETNDVIEQGLQDYIDIGYFENMAEAARNHISEFMNFDEFIDCNGYFEGAMNVPVSEEEEVPFR